MTFSTLIILIAIGILSGAMAGMLGIGGAIIMIPAMVFILGMNQHTAQGTSLWVLLPPISIFAAMNYWKAGYVNLKFAAVLVAAFIVGSYLGSKLVPHIPETVLRKIFAVLLLVVATKMLLSK